MSLISPVPQSTTIKIYSGIPWDASMENIRWFDSAAQRDAYLSTKMQGVWNKCSVTSIGQRIRVQALYNNCIDCNYLSFTNGGMGDIQRTYYAYITSVDYVNAQTVEFQYQIDWIQTYLFDFIFESCLVEREHVNDDTFGLHVVPEQIDTGEYIVDTVVYEDFEPAIVLFYVDKSSYGANLIDNMYMPGGVAYGTMQDTTVINTKLQELNDTPERITALFMGVRDMITPATDSTFFYRSFSTRMFTSFLEGGESYTPKNKKCLIYPYKFSTLDNLQGDVEQFRWEDSNTKGKLDFAIEGAALPKPSMICFPIDYKNMTANADHDNTYSQQMVVYNNFPSCPYITDSYAAWVSQYGTSKAITQAATIVGGAATLVGSIATGNAAGVIGGASTLASGLINQEARDHQIHSLQQHGSISESGLQYARDKIGFRVTQYSIKNKAARRLDKFFTRYGYRVDEVKIPNVTGRQYVNYVKCANGHVGGNVATDAKLAMEQALTQGTSFWHVNNMEGDLNSNPIVT